MLATMLTTGCSDAISFSAIFVWCGFQTGNFAQVRVYPSRSCAGRRWGPAFSGRLCAGQGLCS